MAALVLLLFSHWLIILIILSLQGISQVNAALAVVAIAAQG